MLSIAEASDIIIDAGQRLHESGLMRGGNGNLSCRVKGGILVTPSGRCKGNLKVRDLVVTTVEGGLVTGENPTSELPMHLAIYRVRKDVECVVHCHAPYTVALTAAGREIRPDILPEVDIKYGRVPVTEFAIPSSVESARKLLPHLKPGLVAAILPRHGVVAMSHNMEGAVTAAEGVEYAAKVQYLAEALGEITPYPGFEE